MDPHPTTFALTSSRGTRLAARLEVPRGPVRASAVFAHCFTCSKDLRVERRLTEALVSEGFAVLSFDFAGIGASEGELASGGFAADVADISTAAEHLAGTVAPPALLVGHSLGGAAVLSAAPAIASVRAVATIGAPADPAQVQHVLDGDLAAVRRDGAGVVRIAGRSFEISRAFLDDLAAHPPQASLATFQGAVLLMHAPRDEVVGIENAEALYHAARHPKSFVTLDEADHLLSRADDAAYVASVIGAWARRYLPTADLALHKGYETGGATAVSSDGLRTVVESRGFAMVLDEPLGAGGTQEGPTPYDHLAVALAACTVMTMRLYAQRKGWDVGEIRARAAHDRVHAEDCRDDASGKVDVLALDLELPAGLEAEQRASLLRIAGRCPVHRTLSAKTSVVTRPER